jgi:dolichol-phosphate mannosyltransferase
MKVIVTIPTYNESENIGRLIGEIRRFGADIGIVVADDDSPDGTWKIVAEIAQTDPQVFLLRRMRNKGRGAAGVDAFRFALAHGADVVIEMDADFSHDPRYIPALLEAVERSELVLGSRLIGAGRDQRQSPLRKALTEFSAFYARTVLALPVRDCNSGYRCYQRRVLEAIDLDSIRSTGPSIVQEVLYKAHLAGCRIKEIPIVFGDREAGTSNLNLKRLLRGFLMVLDLKRRHLRGRP